MYCQNCGTEFSGKFCANCGAPAPSSAPNPNAAPPNAYPPTPPYQPPHQNIPMPPQYQQPQKKKGGCLKVGLIVGGVLLGLLILLVVIGGLIGDDSSGQATSSSSHKTEPQTVVLYGNRAGLLSESQAMESGAILSETITVETDLTVELLAEHMSSWTGLDFTLNSAEISGEEVWVDWSSRSTLIQGLDDRAQKQEFFFHDHIGLRWFMLESLADTIKYNFPEVTTVYYTSDGGNAFSLPEMDELGVLSRDVPYLGERYYMTQ